MKPPPPDTLLGPGQRWIITWALGWGVVHGEGFTCRQHHGQGADMVMCRQPSVIFHLTTDESLCEDHMGYHRWVQDDTVFQWRADPVWKYPPPPRRRRIRRASST